LAVVVGVGEHMAITRGVDVGGTSTRGVGVDVDASVSASWRPDIVVSTDGQQAAHVIAIHGGWRAAIGGIVVAAGGGAVDADGSGMLHVKLLQLMMLVFDRLLQHLLADIEVLLVRRLVALPFVM
jgi:hypothetical protein